MADKKNKKNEAYEKEYPENGDNFSAGKPDASPLPNNPAKNAEKTSPEEDKARKEKKH
ncbi:hypothetical protein [Taibaiella lutea]|uniref:hypothetical protein n=1 Tax=Taibaiella lutea TaxID=2608001 RepID=UPI00167FE1EA|nr:hypothetical protein [Taibaiella lutea]